MPDNVICREKSAALRQSVSLPRIAEVDEAIWLRGFWVARRFGAATGDWSGLGLQPLGFYTRQHAEG
jgi:hypothetical protein